MCWFKSNKYRKFKNPKISYIYNETVSVICNNCDSKNEAIFKEEESVEIEKIISLINNMIEYKMNINYCKVKYCWRKNMSRIYTGKYRWKRNI